MRILGKYEEIKLLNQLNKAFDVLKINHLSGVKIPKTNWPDAYVIKYEVTNLYKINLPNAFRLIFTIETDEDNLFVIILDWFNHKDYCKKFKYCVN